VKLTRRKFMIGAAAVAGLALYGESTTSNAPLKASIAVLDRTVHSAAGGTSQSAADAEKIATAIGYAKDQIGKPYLWGGTGPDAYDCSGLVMEAYAAAGVTIPRTSQEQWADLPHAGSPQAGDLVFFPGEDGTRESPGHVGMVLASNSMIQAYAEGFPVEISSYGLSSSLEGIQDGDVIGYARPV
jgi:cell wall-associated NlpC family hydrolase